MTSVRPTAVSDLPGRTSADGVRGKRPAFLITIDTEGDDLWSSPRVITTRNAEFLDRFQSLCETYGLPPTYLTDYEMAISDQFTSFAKRVLRRGTAEVGMHLHAWNSPPIVPLTDDDHSHHPFLIEYEEPVLREKIAHLTDLLEGTFETKMTSHRAGRWGFDSTYARALDDNGYLVDCSVTPHENWNYMMGAPGGQGGPDYRKFPDYPYRLDLTDISQAAETGILEVPMTVRPSRLAHKPVTRALRALQGLPGGLVVYERLMRSRFFERRWLRPNGRNLDTMLEILDSVIEDGGTYAEFMLHSSEFMPGGSLTFATEEQVETLYRHLESLFERARSQFCGQTLTEFCLSYGHAEPTAASSA